MFYQQLIEHQFHGTFKRTSSGNVVNSNIKIEKGFFHHIIYETRKTKTKYKKKAEIYFYLSDH
jgi:hypothetical protein